MASWLIRLLIAFDRMRQQTKDNWFMFEWQTGLTGDPTL